MKLNQYTQTARALGCDVELRLYSDNRLATDRYFKKLWQEIEKFEAAFSRFRPDSELSQLNINAGQTVRISAEFSSLLQQASYFNEVSGGLFNPLILPSLQRQGYKNDLNSKQPESQALDFTDRRTAGFNELQFGDSWAQLPPQTALDFGGIGKGYLADKLAGLTDGTFEGYCFSLGGDMVYKLPDSAEPWQATIQSADDPDLDIAMYTGQKPKYALATSGLVRRRNGKMRFHQIDPRSGQQPSGKYLVSSVAAEKAVAADVLAACLLNGGPALAESLLADDTIGGALLQSKNKTISLGSGFSVKNLTTSRKNNA